MPRVVSLCSVAYAGTWLNKFLTARLDKFPASTLIVITWDEDDYTEDNQILVSLLDPNGDIFAAGAFFAYVLVTGRGLVCGAA